MTLSFVTRCLAAACFLTTTAVFGADMRLVAPAAPGSGWDQLARALAAVIADEANLPVPEIVNLPGASGTVGLGEFMASGGGSDLLVTGFAMLDATLLQRTPVSLDRLTPLARISTEPFGLAVPASSPVHSVEDLRLVVLGDAAKLTWGGGPAGGIDHVATVLLMRALGLDPAHLNFVPFLSSAEAAAAAADDKVGAVLTPVSELVREAKAGRLRLLAVAAPSRLAGLDVPTFGESGVAFEIGNWRGLLARPNLGPEERDRIVALLRRVILNPDFGRVLERRNWRLDFLPADEFRTFLRDEQARVRDALKAAGLLKRKTD